MKKFVKCLLKVGKVILDGAEAIARARRVARDLGYTQYRPYLNNNRSWPQQ